MVNRTQYHSILDRGGPFHRRTALAMLPFILIQTLLEIMRETIKYHETVTKLGLQQKISKWLNQSNLGRLAQW